MDIQRLLLFGALGLVLVMLWQAWVEFQHDYANATVSTTNGASTAPVGNAAVDAPQPVRSVVPSAPAVSVAEEPVAVAAIPQTRLINVETDLIRAQIDPNGGDLVRVELLRHPISIDRSDEPFVLMHRAGGRLFTAQSGLIGTDRDRKYADHGIEFSSARYEYNLGDDDELTVALDWVAPDGVAYQKIFRFMRDSYRIDVDFHIDNQTASDWTGFVYGQLKQTEIEPLGSLGFIGRLPSYYGAAIYTAEDQYDKIDYDEMREDDLAVATESGWVAMLQHYFVAAWLPRDAAKYQFYSGVDGERGNPQYRIGYKTAAPVHIRAGDSGVIKTALFAGPKAHAQLEKQDIEGLLLTVDYGWFTPIASPLFWLLNKIHGVVHNWGWSIILLTLLIKAVFYPLSAASYKSMARMKKLAPRLKTLKERFGDDKRRFQQEMMKVYKTEKVNPAGGCLPMLVQFPVFLALYWTLLESVELRQASFIFWIRDLSAPDPFFVLPLVMGASMWVQFLLNPTPPDPMMKKVMMVMPIGITVISLWFPAGLVLYWVANNVLSIAQQYYITRKYEAA